MLMLKQTGKKSYEYHFKTLETRQLSIRLFIKKKTECVLSNLCISYGDIYSVWTYTDYLEMENTKLKRKCLFCYCMQAISKLLIFFRIVIHICTVKYFLLTNRLCWTF